MSLSYGFSIIPPSTFTTVHRLTLDDGTHCFYDSQEVATIAKDNYFLYKQVTPSNTDLGKWIKTYRNTRQFATWTPIDHCTTEHATSSLYVVIDHDKGQFNRGKFTFLETKVPEIYFKILEKNIACCYLKGYPCQQERCSCKLAYNEQRLVIKKANAYSMNQTDQWILENINLGTTREDGFDHAVERIISFSGQNNKELGGNYQVGGSTYTVATCSVHKIVEKKLNTLFPILGDFITVIHGNFFTWSHLPTYELTVRFDGLYLLHPDAHFQQEKNRFRASWFGKALQNLQQGPCKKDLVVFELLYINNVSNDKPLYKYEKDISNMKSKPAWVGSMKRNAKETIFMGRILKGFFHQQMLASCNKPTLQNILMKLASYGVLNKYGISKLHCLNSTVLKKLLLKIPHQQNLKRVAIYRILNASKYQKWSPLWLDIHRFFPASYGQFLKDEKHVLTQLQKYFHEENHLPLDYILLGPFDHAFRHAIYQVQVADTLKLWRMRFPDRVSGSKDRFLVWKLLKDRKYTQGQILHPNNLELLLKNTSISITEEIFQKTVQQLIQHHVLVETVDRNDSPMLCFLNDYNMMYSFVESIHMLPQLSISVGVPENEELCILYPSENVFNYFSYITGKTHDAVSVKHMTNEPFHVETFTKSKHSKVYLQTQKTIMLIGLENWPFDTIVFVLHTLRNQGKHVKLHFFGYNDLPKMAAPRRRFMPLLEDLHFMPTYRKQIDNRIDELVLETQEELDNFKANNNITDYIIVTHNKKDMQKVKEMNLGLSSETIFRIGDQVITSTGFISKIKSMHYYNKDRSPWGMQKHLYLGTEICLFNDHNIYRANKIKNANPVLSNDIVTPLKKVILFGTIPDYLKTLFENYLAIEKLVYIQHKSLDEKIASQYNSAFTMAVEKLTPLYACEKMYKQNIQQKQQQQQIQNRQEIESTRKRRLKQLFAQQRKKHANHGK